MEHWGDAAGAKEIIAYLREALRGPLPGSQAQARLAPTTRADGLAPAENVRRSAVLLLLHRSPTGLSLPFTLRPKTLRHHGGQISFPGGGMEPQDRSLAMTALRETGEELGITSQGIVILGRLTPLYVAGSHNYVQPFVGWVEVLPPLHPCPTEVQTVIDIPLRTLLEPSTLRACTKPHSRQVISVPCFQVGEYGIWGATAMILNEFLELLREAPSPMADQRLEALAHSSTTLPTKS